jgi:hypothetical protein
MEDSRFDNFYNKLVVPSEKAQASGKTKGIIPFEILKEIIFADPTTQKPQNFDIEGASVEDMKVVKVGKFSQWLLKHYVKPTLEVEDVKSPEYKNQLKEYRRLFLEDLFKMTDLLTKYERVKVHLEGDQKDINKLTPEKLTDIIVNLPEDIKKRLNKNIVKSEKKEVTKDNKYAHPGAEIMQVGPNYTLIKIEGTGDAQREAAGWYGGYYDYMNGESHWCTSPPNSNYFMTYAKKGPLYVMLANDDKGLVGARTGLPQERYQFHFPDSQFMDRMDRQIDLIAFLNGPGAELKEIFKAEFAKGLVTPNTKDVKITSSSSAGRFISLYGFNELFESLPKDIESLSISNTSSENVAYDIPESLGEYTELTALLLNNNLKSLPESIGNCKNLEMLTLTNNPKLEKLPESIADFENLQFITLKGSNPNIIIPPKLAERLVDEGDGFYYAI